VVQSDSVEHRMDFERTTRETADVNLSFLYTAVSVVLQLANQCTGKDSSVDRTWVSWSEYSSVDTPVNHARSPVTNFTGVRPLIIRATSYGATCETKLNCSLSAIAVTWPTVANALSSVKVNELDGSRL
jgi:hypothetical protein